MVITLKIAFDLTRIESLFDYIGANNDFI